MPTKQEFLTFFGVRDDDRVALAYYEGVNWDPRMVLVMKVQAVKGRVDRQYKGTIGALSLTFQTGSPCSDAEWEEVKTNYTELLRLEALHGRARTAVVTPMPTADASPAATARQRKDSSCGCSCIVM